MKTKRAAALAAAFSCAAAIGLGFSCWMPPFDPSLSTSVRFEKKLEKVLSIGPIRYEGIKAKEQYFVPTYLPAPTDGYWVTKEGDTRLAVNYIDTSLAVPLVGPRWQVDDNNYGSLNAVQSMSPDTANVGDISLGLSRGIHIFGTGQTSASPSPAMLGLGLQTATTWNLTMVPANLLGFPPLGSYSLLAIGGSMQNNDATLSTRYLLLAGQVYGDYVLVANRYLMQYHSDAYSIPNLQYVELNYPGPPLAPGAFYWSDTTNDIVIGTSVVTGEIVAYEWQSAYPGDSPVSLSFDQLITDVLHDGTLLARGKITTRAYSSSGQALFTMPTGSFRFIHELNDGTMYYSYFTRTVVVPDNKDDWKGQVYFDVARYPTDKLSELAD